MSRTTELTQQLFPLAAELNSDNAGIIVAQIVTEFIALCNLLEKENEELQNRLASIQKEQL